MIDNPNDAFAQYEAQARLRAQLAREVTPLNKAALFAVLQAAGVQRVTVHFDGAGDSGQIESIDATNPDETAAELPDGTIEIRTPALGRKRRADRDHAGARRHREAGLRLPRRGA